MRFLKTGMKAGIFFLFLIAVLLGYYLLMEKIIQLLQVKDWLFYQTTKEYHFVIGMNLVAIFTGEVFIHKWKEFSKKEVFGIILVLLLVSTYGFVSNTITVTEDKFIVKTALQPFGKEYSYSDVDKVDAYFLENVSGYKSFFKYNNKKKGLFMYDVTLDGTTYHLTQPVVNPNSKYANAETYLELEELDQKLVQMGVDKSSTEDNVEHNHLDQKYVERFLRIVRNK